MLVRYVKKVGVLRALLALLAVAAVIGSRFTGDRAVYSGPEMIPTLIVPAVAPIVFFVLLLDMLMGSVFMIDKSGAERARFRFIVGADLVLAAAVLLSWLPYFVSLNS